MQEAFKKLKWFGYDLGSLTLLLARAGLLHWEIITEEFSFYEWDWR